MWAYTIAYNYNSHFHILPRATVRISMQHPKHLPPNEAKSCHYCVPVAPRLTSTCSTFDYLGQVFRTHILCKRFSFIELAPWHKSHFCPFIRPSVQKHSTKADTSPTFAVIGGQSGTCVHVPVKCAIDQFLFALAGYWLEINARTILNCTWLFGDWLDTTISSHQTISIFITSSAHH